MHKELAKVGIGLALALACLAIGVGLGISFGINEDFYQNYIASGIARHPEVHDQISQNAIWRWILRAHFHATGIGAFVLALIVLTAMSNMNDRKKQATAILIGLGGLYPIAWFVMFLLAPAIGRKAAHQHWLVEVLTYLSVGGLLLGSALLVAGLFFPRRPPAAQESLQATR